MSESAKPSKNLKVVIVGRPNVGKSTLFNRIMSQRKALVHNKPGVTRDRLYGKVQWYYPHQDYTVILTDTGGLEGTIFSKEIERQVAEALKDASIVLFVLDAQTGVVPQDEIIFLNLKKHLPRGTPLLGVVNKVDDLKHADLISDFYSMGFEDLTPISAEHGNGIEDLKDKIVELGREASEGDFLNVESRNSSYPRITIVGKPNVGKSTLMNCLLKYERVITSPIAGTTVDSVDSLVELSGRKYILTDTAGVRRKNKTEQGIEVLSVVQTKKALEQTDLALLMIDGDEGPTDQDEKIAGMIEQAGCAVAILVNKWDLARLKKGFLKEDAAEQLRKRMAFLSYAPIIFLSAKKNQGLNDLGDLIEEILSQRSVKIPTHEFSEWVRAESNIHNPFNAKFYLCHQSGRHPPTFVCHVNDPRKIDFSLKRHLVNALRARWGFMGSPIRMSFVSPSKE